MPIKSLIVALAAAVLGAMTPAIGQNAMDHYRAYNQAIASNDREAADLHGEAAWRAAEDEWGDSAETATLAYNLARLRLDGDDASDALPPARRALELAQGGVSGDAVRTLDAELLVTILEVNEGRRRQARIDRLIAAVTAHEAATETSDLLARAHLTLAGDFVRQRDALSGAEHARRASEIATLLGVAYADLAIEALALEGRALLDADRYADARDAYEGALSQFPSNAGAANSQAYASLLGSLAFATTLSTSLKTLANGAASCESRGGVVMRTASIDIVDDPRGDFDCGEWQVRSAPEYPANAAADARQGSAVIVYTLGSDGTVEESRIVSENPANARWGDIVVREMRNWRRDIPADAPAQCRSPQAVAFGFAIVC